MLYDSDIDATSRAPHYSQPTIRALQGQSSSDSPRCHNSNASYSDENIAEQDIGLDFAAFISQFSQSADDADDHGTTYRLSADSLSVHSSFPSSSVPPESHGFGFISNSETLDALSVGNLESLAQLDVFTEDPESLEDASATEIPIVRVARRSGTGGTRPQRFATDSEILVAGQTNGSASPLGSTSGGGRHTYPPRRSQTMPSVAPQVYSFMSPRALAWHTRRSLVSKRDRYPSIDSVLEDAERVVAWG
ncbi:hypothetical protein K474DRAFT_1660930 [Panus rudis PR-1116 ss-1]|nr:hypothetical protein K474DRAFT_1660930 [Panus rudis PR-1116 ss-1]